MDNVRSAGVLLHISSLPAKYGIGSLGKEAYRFAKSLKKAGVRYWQILPLVQTGYGDSPYQSVSCSSGNPYFIDLDLLAEQGLLTKKELKELVKKGMSITALCIPSAIRRCARHIRASPSTAPNSAPMSTKARMKTMRSS